MCKQRVPILVYHHIYPDDQAKEAGAAAGVIGASDFRQHMQYVQEEGWQVVSTSAMINWLLDDKPLPAKACLIHFDNGWLDTYTVALPILETFNMTATCFPITSGIEAATEGKPIKMRTLTEGQVEKPFMIWDQVGKLLEADWEIGGHTHTHCKIAEKHDAEGDSAVIWEAETANQLFKQRLGFTPLHFAYPSGSHNKRTSELLADQYRSLRLWRWDWPISWQYTSKCTSRLGIECQNIDSRVSFEDFQRVLREA